MESLPLTLHFSIYVIPPSLGGPIVPHTITRRAMLPDDVVIEIKFAGIW